MIPRVSNPTLRFLRTINRVPACHEPKACTFATSATLCSGHSKWATIKHDKAKKDSRINKARNLHARDIANAVRMYGADPKYNGKLVNALAAAKSSGMSKSSIEAAIMRGEGKSATGARLEALLIEAIVGKDKPVAMIVECETENKASALQELRMILKSGGGVQTPTQFFFERRGRVVLARKEGMGVDEVMEALLEEGGVIDVYSDEERRCIVDTVPDALKAVESTALETLNAQVEKVDIVWQPNKDTTVSGLEDEQAETINQLVDILEEYSGVQRVWTNLAV